MTIEKKTDKVCMEIGVENIGRLSVWSDDEGWEVIGDGRVTRGSVHSVDGGHC